MWALAVPRACVGVRSPPLVRLRRASVSRGSRVVVARASSSDDDAPPPSGEDTAELLSRLHVNFLALRRGSRFAAQEFALVATEAYERGVSLTSLRMDIALLGLSTSNALGLSEQDAFLSHLGMSMMTLYELGWPSPGGGEGWSPVAGDPEEDSEARGLLAYIRATHQRSDAGYTLKRMEMERLMTLQARAGGEWSHPEGWAESQGAVGPPRADRPDNIPVSRKGIASRGPQGAGALGETDAVMLMRVNCRLTLLLREFVFISRGLQPVTEVMSAAELELEAEAAAENERARPEGDAEITDDLDDLPGGVDDVTDPSGGWGPQVALEWCRADRDAPRDLASRLLVSYVSALTVHPVGLRGFAAAALDAYELGLPASTLARSLRPEEFDVEGSRRGMFGSSADATKFFSLFLTTAYVTAQEEGLLPAFTPGESQTTAKAAVAAAADPDMWAWTSAPGDPSGDRLVGWAAVAAGTMDEDAADEAEETRRRVVAGMRASVVAWMEMDRAELKSRVATSLSVDEDDDVEEVSASFDENVDDVINVAVGRSPATDPAAGYQSIDRSTPSERPAASVSPPGDIPWQRDDFLANSSITIAALTIQRAVVSFTLQEIAGRRAASAKR